MHVCTPWKTNFPHNCDLFYGWLCSTLVLSKLKIHFISLSCTKQHLHVTSDLLLNPSFPWSMSLETTPTPLCRFLPGLINNTGCTFSERSVKQVAHYPPLQSFSSGPSPLNRCGVTGWAGNYHRQKKQTELTGEAPLIGLQEEERGQKGLAGTVPSMHHPTVASHSEYLQ